MAEGQIESKGQKLALGCHHTSCEWDFSHAEKRIMAMIFDFKRRRLFYLPQFNLEQK